MRAPVCKWQVLLQHFDEFALDPCENCISCHHHQEQDIGDVLRLVHNVFEAVGDYRSRHNDGMGCVWGTWEASVCNLLCRKQDKKTKETYPEYVRNVFWDLGAHFPKLSESDWKEVLWHAVSAGVLIATPVVNTSIASVWYKAGNTVVGVYEAWMTNVVEALSSPTQCPAQDVGGPQGPPCSFSLVDIQTFYGSTKYSAVHDDIGEAMEI